MKLFSQRNNPTSDRYNFEISQHVRSRILHSLRRFDGQQTPRGFSFGLPRMFDQIGELLLSKFGALKSERARYRIDSAAAAASMRRVLPKASVCRTSAPSFISQRTTSGCPLLFALGEVARTGRGH